MSQYKYIDIYVDSNGQVLQSDLSTITQHSTNTKFRVLSEDLVCDSIYVNILEVDGTMLPKKLMLLQPTLEESYKVWEYRLTASDTAKANPDPAPMRFTVSIEIGDLVINLPTTDISIIKSLESQVVIPSASSIDGISDGFNAVSAEILRLDELRGQGIDDIIDNGDGTITISWEDNTVRTSDLTGPQGPQGLPGQIIGLGPDLVALEALTGQGIPYRNAEGDWTINTLDTDLTAIAGLPELGTGFLRKTGNGLWSLDTNSYALASHSHLVATTSSNGFMSAGDKSKLDGIATNANNYSHPVYTIRSVTSSGVDVLGIFTSDSLGHITGITTRTLPNASSSAPGVMTAAQFDKLAGIANNANNYVHPPAAFTAFGDSNGNALTGATVFSRITTDSTGHITGNSNRELTPSDIGAASANHTHGNIGSSGFMPSPYNVSNLALVTTDGGFIIARTISDSLTASSLSDVSSNLVTERDVYNGLVLVNPIAGLSGSGRQRSDVSIYAPTTVGTNGQVLQSNGSGAPSWVNAPGLVEFGLNTTHIRTLTGAATDINSDTGHPFTINVGAYKGILFKFCRRLGTSPNFTWICDYAVVPNNPNVSGINISFDVNDSIILTSSKELRRGDLQTFNQTFATIVRTSTSNTSLSLTARMSYCNNEDEIRIYGIS
jgi:hypothetical protein